MDNRTGKGRLLLTSVAVLTAVGGFLADWNRTHLLNPNWTPHAKSTTPRPYFWVQPWERVVSTSCAGGASTQRLTSASVPCRPPSSGFPRGRASRSPGPKGSRPSSPRRYPG